MTRTYGTDDDPMTATGAQCAAAAAFVFTTATVHPYSGAMTLSNGRQTVAMLNRFGRVTYLPAADPRAARCN